MAALLPERRTDSTSSGRGAVGRWWCGAQRGETKRRRAISQASQAQGPAVYRKGGVMRTKLVSGWGLAAIAAVAVAASAVGVHASTSVAVDIQAEHLTGPRPDGSIVEFRLKATAQEIGRASCRERVEVEG